MTRRPGLLLALFLPLASALFVSGCASRVIQVTIENRSGGTLRNIEVEYPGGSFGLATMEQGGTYRYPIKPQRKGPVQIRYVNDEGRMQSVTGTVVEHNDSGSLRIILSGEGAEFSPEVNRSAIEVFGVSIS